MKKTTLYLAMAAFMLASCSKNEVGDGTQTTNDPNQISFNSTTGTTRAVANDLAKVQGGFNVLGYKHGTPADSTVFIDGTQANAEYKFNTAWEWTNKTAKEWPTVLAEYPLTFYAEFPQKDMSGNTALNKAIILPLDMTSQVDYLVAKSHVTNRPTTGFAPLNFKHILSNLLFKIKTSKDYTVHIQSVRVVNTAKEGRTFDYATLAYEPTEPTYTADQLAKTDGTYKTAEGFFFYNNIATPWSFNASEAEAEQEKAVPAENGIMMQMPQMTVNPWTKANAANGLGKFETDAAAWKAGTSVDAAAKLAAWYDVAVGAPTQPGMKASAGWEGTRIEVIYRIEDKDGKSVVGRKDGETYKNALGADVVAAKDYFVRVGFPLDLSQIKTTGTSVGWELNKRYTYTISLGTVDASNGILLDPDYKDKDGASDMPKIPVENPKTDPGTPVTPAGLINFDVAVENWADNAQSIK